MDKNAIADWHGCFDRKSVITLTMVLDDTSTLPLTIDLLCAEHSALALRSDIRPAADEVPATMLSALATDQIGEAAHTEGQ